MDLEDRCDSRSGLISIYIALDHCVAMLSPPHRKPQHPGIILPMQAGLRGRSANAQYMLASNQAHHSTYNFMLSHGSMATAPVSTRGSHRRFLE